MYSRPESPLVNLLMFRKIIMTVLLLLLVPGMAFAMGKGGTGGSGGGGGTGGGGGADFDVIIVGAGASGLYAAYELDNLGFSIKVLEGRPRHGGRVWAQNNTTPRGRGQDLGSVLLDVFAETITGNKNWLYDDVMALDKNRVIRVRTGGTLISFNGATVLESDTSKKGTPEIYDYWDFYYDSGSYTGPDVDIESYLCDTLSVCRGDPDFNLYVQGYPAGEFTTSLGEMGMRSLVEQENLWTAGDGGYTFPDPAHTYLDTLDELYFNPVLDRVEFGNDVTRIDTSGSVAVVTGQQGINYTAHAVLVTIPLGNLKAGDVSFTPALSASKQNAIDGLGFGRGGRLFLQFSSRVLSSDIDSFYTDGNYCGWGSDLAYKGGDGDRHIQCWSVGELGDNLDALRNNKARIAAAVSDLDGLYAGTPFTDAFVAGFWKRTNDKSHQRGAYSFPTVGSYPTDGSPSYRDNLAAPEGTKLYFAGEHTALENPASVIGALESGLRAASEIAADHDPQ